MNNIAVFIDRDGTITEEVGYLTDCDRLRLIPGSAEAITRLNKANIKAIVVTNQAGVARGYFDEEMVIECNKKLVYMLNKLGAKVDEIYYCPHHPSSNDKKYGIECDCRKPKTGLLLKAKEKFKLNLEECYVIGDKSSDIELAKNANCYGILVKSGYGSYLAKNKELLKIKPLKICENLFEAVDFILKREGEKIAK